MHVPVKRICGFSFYFAGSRSSGSKSVHASTLLHTQVSKTYVHDAWRHCHLLPPSQLTRMALVAIEVASNRTMVLWTSRLGDCGYWCILVGKNVTVGVRASVSRALSVRAEIRNWHGMLYVIPQGRTVTLILLIDENAAIQYKLPTVALLDHDIIVVTTILFGMSSNGIQRHENEELR